MTRIIYNYSPTEGAATHAEERGAVFVFLPLPACRADLAPRERGRLDALDGLAPREVSPLYLQGYRMAEVVPGREPLSSVQSRMVGP